MLIIITLFTSMQHIKDILINNVMIDELFHKVAFNFHIMNNTLLKGV